MDRHFIDLFTKEVLSEAGLDAIPDDCKEDYTRQMSYELRRRIGILAVKSLDSKSYKDFEELVKDNPNQDLFSVIEFFRNRLPNFNDIVAQALYDFKCEILEHAEELRSQLIHTK